MEAKILETKPDSQKQEIKKEKRQRKTRSAKRVVVDTEKTELKQRRHNVLVVRKTTSFKTLVMTAKNILKNQFDTIELHAVDEASYLTITLVAQCLMKYKYVTLARLKTKTVQILEDAEGHHHEAARLQPRLIAHLTKTAEFDSIYDEFEIKFKTMMEENKEQLEEHEAEQVSAN